MACWKMSVLKQHIISPNGEGFSHCDTVDVRGTYNGKKEFKSLATPYEGDCNWGEEKSR